MIVYVVPPRIKETAVTDVEPVPVLLSTTYESPLAGVVVSQVAARLLLVPLRPVADKLLPTWVTSAVAVKLPKSPNTNPAMAMAAMRVMAMRMTVAMTGEMAFLPLTFVICIVVSQPVRPFK